MCAHIWFQNVDSEIPSFSNKWIKNILKERLGYQGIVFSDDLSMAGAGKDNSITKYLKSIDAGCDMAIICNDRKGVIEILDFLNENSFELNNRLSIMRKLNDVSWNELKASKRAMKTKEILKEIRS
jgi:beta-N-acetylhexosaminidase